ncbi:MAG: hypothetical protein IT370_13330 [Deltaproteobacteria bacterium]|nr:hypothetical protein [Deltaproteobacteria bacterium]
MGWVSCALLAAGLWAGCGGSGGDDDDDGGNTVVDAAVTGDGSTGVDGAVMVDGSTGGPLTVSGFDMFSGTLGYHITCDPAGTCYGHSTTVNQLAPGATTTTIIGNPTSGLVSNSPSSILRDSAGNLYTNVGCSGTPGVYKRPAGTTTWATVGTGLTGSNLTACNFDTIGIDPGGNLYIGFASLPGLFKLTGGTGAWTDSGTGANRAVRATATRGNDVFIGDSDGVKVLTGGAGAWTALGTGNPGNVLHLRFDGAGNLYTVNSAGIDLAGVYKLAAGTTTWVEMTNLDRFDVNSPRVSNIAFDAMNNGWMIARPTVNTGSNYSLMKLPAGATAWTVALALTVTVNDTCVALASDNNGHLVAQCGNMVLRSRP